MNKMNKKGFTLIEMLVVIAIIAVLVSIIIPTVTSATDKAAAATNAANLRSVKAEMVTAMLTKDTSKYTWPADNTITSVSGVTFKDLTAAPTGAGNAANFVANDNFKAVKNGNNVTVTYDGLTIDDWAKAAG